MADFDVSVRASYRDIARLVLDLRPGDYELTSDAKVLKWRNSAPPPWTASSPRFGDASMSTHARRPLKGTGGAVAFRNSLTHGLDVPLETAMGLSQSWTFAFEVDPGDRTPKQAILHSAAGGFAVWRISSSAADHGYLTSAGEVTAVGEMDAGTYMLAFEGGGLADMLFDGVEQISGGAAANIQFTASSTRSLRIGYTSTGDYFDGQLRSVRIWNRTFAAKERDFAFQTMGPVDVSQGAAGYPRATMQVRSWVDDTGNLSLRQARRVNPLGGRHQQFRLATIPAGYDAAIVQIACATAGVVVADSALGGDLYTLDQLERASPAVPTVTQDAGWSSIFDVRITTAGHYTFLISRENHGGVYCHLDVAQG